MLALAILPLMAGFGLFGERWSTVDARTPSLELSLTYPTRFRYKQLNQLELWVRNTGARTTDTLRVSLDTAFARMFSTITAIPPLDEAYALSLLPIAPGDTRLAIVEIQAERYGRHRGTLRVAGADTAAIPLTISIFP